MNDINNRSKTYLLPSLAKVYNIPYNQVFSLFLGITGKTKELDGTVYLWVKNDENIEGYTQKHVYDNDILLEYKYPNKDVYTKILDGKYSKLNESDKTEIINYFNLPNNHKVVQILYKSPFLQKQMEEELKVSLKSYELGEKIDYVKEFYNPELSRD